MVLVVVAVVRPSSAASGPVAVAVVWVVLEYFRFLATHLAPLVAMEPKALAVRFLAPEVPASLPDAVAPVSMASAAAAAVVPAVQARKPVPVALAVVTVV